MTRDRPRSRSTRGGALADAARPGLRLAPDQVPRRHAPGRLRRHERPGPDRRAAPARGHHPRGAPAGDRHRAGPRRRVHPRRWCSTTTRSWSRTSSGVDTETDVAYAMILDRDGRVAAHSHRPESVGTLLSGAMLDRILSTDAPLAQELRARTGRGSTTSRRRWWSTPSAGARPGSVSRGGGWMPRSWPPGASSSSWPSSSWPAPGSPRRWSRSGSPGLSSSSRSAPSPSRAGSWSSASSRRPPTRSASSPSPSTTWPASSTSSAPRSSSSGPRSRRPTASCAAASRSSPT